MFYEKIQRIAGVVVESQRDIEKNNNNRHLEFKSKSKNTNMEMD